MEAAGLVVGLAGVFNTALDAYKGVRCGRGFGKDYTICSYKLSLARLRLSRWGESLGLSGEIKDDHTLPPDLGNKEHVEKAENVLRLIIDLVEHFEELPKDDDYESIDQPKDAKLFKQLQRLSDNRKNNVRPEDPIWQKDKFRTGLWKKTKWVMYKKEECEKLVQEVSQFTTDLVELFPATKASCRELCKEDGVELAKGNTEAEMEELKKAAEAVDDDLLESLLNAICESVSQPHHYHGTS